MDRRHGAFRVVPAKGLGVEFGDLLDDFGQFESLSARVRSPHVSKGSVSVPQTWRFVFKSNGYTYAH